MHGRRLLRVIGSWKRWIWCSRFRNQHRSNYGNGRAYLAPGSINPELKGTGVALCLERSRRSNCEDNGKKSEKEKQRGGHTCSFPPSPSISHHTRATIWMPSLYPRLTRPCAQASSRYSSYLKRLGTECDIEFSRQAWQVASGIAEDD